MSGWNYYYKPVSWADPVLLTKDTTSTIYYDWYWRTKYGGDPNAWVIRYAEAETPNQLSVVYTVVQGAGDREVAEEGIVPAYPSQGKSSWIADDDAGTMATDAFALGSDSAPAVVGATGGGPVTLTSYGTRASSSSSGAVPMSNGATTSAAPSSGRSLGFYVAIAAAAGVAYMVFK